MQKHQAEALKQFDRIVDLPVADRALALAALDPAMAVAVSELLRADAASTGVLDQGLQAFATQLVGTEAADAAHVGTLKFNDVIGAFVLQRMLGRGGMGEVWLAERQDAAQANHFGRVAHRETSFVQQVALKVLKRGMDSDALSARFVQERKILAELNHPHFARFIDGGVSLDGRLYFAMEYVDGVNLMEHASAKNLSVRERVRLLAEVSEAVAYAQNHLVVHRDLKPSNILVDASGAVRVLDFGIAKLLGERAPTDTLTQTGVHVLSPAYAAPEQVLGLAISTATDVYALGVILFELITGALPHARRLVSYEALLAQIKEEQTPVPSRALRGTANTGASGSLNSARVAREVAGDLDTIILTALQREPARRYATAAALADDLRRWLDARPIAAQPDSRSYRVKKFVARNRVMVGSASTVLLALIAGLAVALWQAGVAREQAKLAQAQTVRAEREAATGRRITDFALSLVHELNPLSQATKDPKTPQQLLTESIQRARTELSQEGDARATVLNKLGMLLSVTGDLTGAESAVQEALDIALKLSSKELAYFQFNLAAIRMQQSRNVEAERLLLQALPNFSSDIESRKYAAMAQSHLARIAREQDQLDLALSRIGAAKALFVQSWGSDHANTIELEGHRAILFFELGQYASAETAYRNAIAGFERIGGRDFPRLMAPIAGLAKVQAVRGDYQQAKRNYQRALTNGKATMGKSSPYVISIELDLIELLCALGELPQAKALLQNIDEKSLAQRPTLLSKLARARALVRRADGQFEEELLQLQVAQQQAIEVNAKASARQAVLLSDLARNAVSRKAFCDAERWLESAQSMFDSLPNVRMIDRLVLIEAHSEVLALHGNAPEAKQNLQNAIQELTETTGAKTVELDRLKAQLYTLQNGSALANREQVKDVCTKPKTT